MGHHAMNLTTLHADVAGIVNREAQGLTHIFLERMAPIVAVDAHDAHARVYDLDTSLPAENLRPSAWDMALAVIEIEVLGRFPREIARSLDLHSHIRQQITHMLMLHDRLSTACRVTLGPFEGVFVGGSGDTDCGDRRDRARPCEGLADDEVAVAFRAGNNVLFGNAHVVEHERIVLTEAMAHRVNDLLDAEAQRASWHHDCAQTLLAALRLVRPDDAYVDVGTLFVPPAGIARPVFASIQHVLAVHQLGGETDAYGRRLWCIEICGAAGTAPCLAYHPAGKILSLRIRAGRPKPLLLFGIGAEPGDVHKAQTIDQERRREARVDGANLLGDQLEVEVTDAATTVLLGKESHGEPTLVRLDVSRFGLGEGLMRVARCICIGNERSEHVLREVARCLPQLLLFFRQSEIDGHFLRLLNEGPRAARKSGDRRCAPLPMALALPLINSSSHERRQSRQTKMQQAAGAL